MQHAFRIRDGTDVEQKLFETVHLHEIYFIIIICMNKCNLHTRKQERHTHLGWAGPAGGHIAIVSRGAFTIGN